MAKGKITPVREFKNQDFVSASFDIRKLFTYLCPRHAWFIRRLSGGPGTDDILPFPCSVIQLRKQRTLDHSPFRYIFSKKLKHAENIVYLKYPLIAISVLIFEMSLVIFPMY